jgi:hypothetical protein
MSDPVTARKLEENSDLLRKAMLEMERRIAKVTD